MSLPDLLTDHEPCQACWEMASSKHLSGQFLFINSWIKILKINLQSEQTYLSNFPIYHSSNILVTLIRKLHYGIQIKVLSQFT